MTGARAQHDRFTTQVPLPKVDQAVGDQGRRQREETLPCDEGKYASSSDYVRDLIRKDQEEKDKLAALQAAITLGLESGDAGELDMDAIKRKATHTI